jgi:hypothetical protein
MVQIIKALSASTKVSAKIRPIVKNPDPRAKNDARMAPYGVFKYSQRRGKYFAPIRGTGEYGAAIRYLNRNKVLMRVRGQWEVFTRQEMESMQLSSHTLQNHPKRKIGRSGLAKSSWAWLLGKLGAMSASNQSEIRGSTTVEKVAGDASNAYWGIISTNRLGYIRKALIGGRQSLSTVISRATGMMRYDMKEITKDAVRASGLKAA